MYILEPTPTSAPLHPHCKYLILLRFRKKPNEPKWDQAL